jgi:hypothetical protein
MTYRGKQDEPLPLYPLRLWRWRERTASQANAHNAAGAGFRDKQDVAFKRQGHAGNVGAHLPGLRGKRWVRVWGEVEKMRARARGGGG